ncbi:hypothetical protein [Arthrobacter sp. MMS24-S77]
MTPKALEALPAADRIAVAQAFGHALPPVFGFAAVVLAVAFVLTLFLPARELRTTAHSDTAHSDVAPSDVAIPQASDPADSTARGAQDD